LSRVRPRFSVLLGYSSLVIRFVSSLLFSIIVVRSLSPQDFSVWVFGFSILPILSIGYDLWGWAYARRHVLGVRSSILWCYSKHLLCNHLLDHNVYSDHIHINISRLSISLTDIFRRQCLHKCAVLIRLLYNICSKT